MINPCVIIATHNRLSITTTNIKLLLAHGVKVVLVVSDHKEKEYYQQFPIEVIFHPNYPLGAKWQAGIDYAKQFDPSHLIPLGSDDLLSKDFMVRHCNGNIATGFKSWYIWSENKLYLLRYLASQVLGGGRVYSRAALQKMDYKLFDKTKNRLLDDYGWNNSQFVWYTSFEPEIIAVKGNWSVMNPVDLKHRNVKLMATYEGIDALNIMKNKFNYVP